MNAPRDLTTSFIDPDDLENNTSSNPRFEDVLNARLSRRGMLKGTVGTAASAVLGSLAVSACGGGSDDPVADTGNVSTLSFNAVPKGLADAVVVPAGYTATVLYALGDPLKSTVPAFKNDGTDTDYDNRSGDCHDGIEYFGLSADGTKPDRNGSDRGLLAMNHEYQNNLFLHATGPSALPRPAAEIDKEVAVHGNTIVEVTRANGVVSYVKDSKYNRRITASTEMNLNGPVKGNALVKTKFSPDGSKTRGTQNNCGTGYTPWGTFLTCEENWIGYFTRGATDNTVRGATSKAVAYFTRYGLAAGAPSRYGWESGGTADIYARWIAGQTGTSTDGTDDYRNIANTFGYVVEIDPYDPTVAIRKRTAMGRFAHEAACFGKPTVGKPLAFYMGDDSRGEYIYKFVSKAVWAEADASPANRITTGDKYLDEGTLYVAKFNSDGTGTWVALTITTPAISGYTAYAFADQADVLVNARLAADAVGATKMDRPEWGTVNPANNDVYFTLTNNSNRVVNATRSSQQVVDSANPRFYTDTKLPATQQTGNVNGHILRFAETGADAAALTFKWDVYLFAAEAGADAGKVNLSGLTADNDFSSADGLWFSKSTGLCWVQTDDGAYTDVTNCMLLASVAGSVGDGAKQTLSYTKTDGTTLSVDTYVGRKPTADQLKRFLVGPKEAEVTGITETPDGKTLFVCIQHPGEDTAAANLADPTKYGSQWPSISGYGAGKRPRSATIVITKTDGGRIGR